MTKDKIEQIKEILFAGAVTEISSGVFFKIPLDSLDNKIRLICQLFEPQPDEGEPMRLLTEEEIEILIKSFWDKYSGKGLTSSEVMELHHSELWELITKAQLTKVNTQHQQEIEEIWKELEGHLKLDSDNDRRVVLGHLKPYRNDGIDFVKMEWVGWYQSHKAKHRKE